MPHTVPNAPRQRKEIKEIHSSYIHQQLEWWKQVKAAKTFPHFCFCTDKGTLKACLSAVKGWFMLWVTHLLPTAEWQKIVLLLSVLPQLYLVTAVVCIAPSQNCAMRTLRLTACDWSEHCRRVCSWDVTQHDEQNQSRTSSSFSFWMSFCSKISYVWS